MPFHRGSRTSSKDSIPYGEAASARALTVRAVIVFTFWFSSVRPCLMMSTIDFAHTKVFQLLASKPSLPFVRAGRAMLVDAAMKGAYWGVRAALLVWVAG